MAPRRHLPQRHAIPDWLTERSVLSRVLAWPGGGGASAEETRQWLHARGLDQQDYGPICERFDALHDQGIPPQRALELALRPVREGR